MTDLRITQLESGLTVATERVPGALSVATGVWVGVGSRDEPAELSGVSHFLEHLLFKGTATRTSQEISRSVDRVGGDFNAFTSKEYTAYYCRLPARHAMFCVDLLGDVLIRPALRETDVDSERVVIRFGDQEVYPRPVDDAGLARLSDYMRGDDVRIHVSLGVAAGSWTVWGCDLTDGYVRINADYTT